MADLAAASNMLKETWPHPLETAYTTEQVALQRIEATSEGVTNDASGRYALVPLRTGRGQGIGSRSERQPLPQPGQRVRNVTRCNLAWHYGVTDFTGQVVKLADSDPRSFINIVDEEMQGLKEDLRYDFSRQVYNDRWGAVARLNDPGSTQTITADGVESTVTFTNASNDYTYYLEEGMLLDLILVDSNDADNAAGSTACTKINGSNPIEVTTVNYGDDTSVDIGFTWTGSADLSITAAANDTWFFVRAGSFYAEASVTTLADVYTREITGLRSIVSASETIQGQPATPWWWQAQEADFSGSSGVYSESRMLRAIDDTRIRAGEYPKVFFTDMGGRRAIWNFFSQPGGGLSTQAGTDYAQTGVRRFNNTTEYMQGISSIPFNYNGQTLEIVEDVRFPAQQYTNNQNTFLLGVCTDKVKQYQADEGWHFMDEGGSSFIPAGDRSDAYEVRMRHYSNLATTKRNCHLKITGLTPII